MKPIERVIKEFNLKVVNIEPITHNSFSCQVYKLTPETGDYIILKIPSQREKLFRETKMLQRLSYTSLPVPTVFDTWEGDDENPGAMLLSFIDGNPASVETIDEDLSYQMGQLLGELHTVPMPGFGHEDENGFTYVENNDWWHFVKTKLDRILANSEKLLSPGTFQKANDYFHIFFMNHPPADGPCAVHTDYRPGNILVKANQITGLVDFESARGGSADFDFSKIKLYVWDKFPGTRTAFEAGYRSIRPLPNLDRLLDFNVLFHAINHIDWCLKRGITDHKQFLSENVRIVEQVVREP